MDAVYFVQGAASPVLDSLMLAVTNLGHDLTYIALLVITYLGVSPVQGRRLGLLFLGAMYFNGLFKDFFSTPRPFELDPEVLRVPSAAESAAGAGFPSGHAQSSTTFWGVAAWYVRRPWFTALAVMLVALISFSRVYLGVHLPIDIIAGIGLGLLAVALAPVLDRTSLSCSRLLQLALALAVPLLVHLLFPAVNSGILLGGLSGFLAGPLLVRHRLPGTLAGRVLVTALGLALVFIVLLSSSALLPDEVKRHPVGEYLRYLVIALTGVALTPALFRLFWREPASAHARESDLADGYETGD